jgi:HD-like signal output (HDOD) protein
LFQAEKQIFGVSHAEVGAYLLGLWGLPEAIVQAIAFHHFPRGFVSKSFELCGIVHVAELMEHHEVHLPHGWDKLTGADEAYLESLGLTGRIQLWRDYLHKNT